MTLSRFILCVVLASAVPAAAADWTEFRGPSRQGLATSAALPLTWSEAEHIAWKVALPGTAWSSPVIQDGRIYLTTAVPQSQDARPAQSLRVLCVDAASGDMIWNVEAFLQPGGDEVEIHQKNSHASPTPIIDGERLYAHFGPHGTACLALRNGAIVWQTHELQYKPTHGTGGSPALADDMLVICCDGHDVQYVAGLDRNSGELRWKTPRDTSPQRGFSFCTPAIIDVAGQSQAICPGSDAVFSYNPQTGREIWRVRYEGGYSVVPRPVVGHGLVYICSGFGDARLLAIDPTGTGDVTGTHVRWTLDKGVPKSPSVLLVDEDLYLVDDRGIATCVNARTGDVHWQERLGGKYSASPIYADGRVYCLDEDGTTIVLGAGSRFHELARNTLAEGERTYASPAVIDDAIVLRTEAHLYRIQQ